MFAQEKEETIPNKKNFFLQPYICYLGVNKEKIFA